jgi:hypothetical protein
MFEQPKDPHAGKDFQVMMEFKMPFVRSFDHS